MPWDCDTYWRFDSEKDADIWPVPLKRQLPVVILAVLLFVCLLCLIVIFD